MKCLKFMYVILLLLCAGCWDNRELEQQIFVQSMGVDKGLNGNVDVTFRLAVPRAFGTSAQAPSTKNVGESTKNITISARSILEAMTLADVVTERTLNYRHIRAITFGEQIAREGLSHHLDAFVRFPEFRRSVYFFIAKGTTAQTVIKTANPVVETSVSRYIEGLVRNANRMGFVRMVTLHEFLVETEQPNVNVVLPLIITNPIVASEKDGSSKSLTSLPELHQKSSSEMIEAPGASKVTPLSRAGGNSSEFIGLAVFKGGKMIDDWSGWDSMVYGLLRGTYKRGVWTFQHPNNKYTFSMEIKPSRKENVVVEWSDNQAVLNVDLKLEANVLELQSLEQHVSPEDKPVLEQTMNDVIRERTEKLISKAQADGVDPMYFARFIRTQMFTTDEYENLNWLEWFAKAKVNVTVETKIRRPGLQIQPPILRE
ncbi:Ger(x)C family spore germination protein [Heliobacterium chlorum]|uniref:Ger(X)C family spore germination protein n=1 Tax=Heliobacterium chlorum TaxID=2698 RepID=A0ABR7T8X8_HELCL|nr:Ger(x)C family spore germination protein [Heliobacterium chlorum]MBC9786637.1 Ger(x)C family spore germination protein [Heliobacterium chlorum]